MGKQQDVIEVNGNRYDAVTGELISSATQKATAPKPAASAGKNMDGFVRRNVPAEAVKKSQTPAKPSHQVHAKPARSKTLMRHVVKKPTKAETIKTPTLPSTEPSVAQQSSLSIDSARLSRAGQVAKNQLVSRFGSFRGIDKKVTHLPVKPVPSPVKAAHGVSMPIDDVPPASAEDFGVPLSSIDMALKNATSHEEPRPKKSTLRQRAAKKVRMNPRAFTIAAGLFVVLLVGGFLTYRHLPQLAVQVAATRAGVDANLPSYQPSGFSLSGPVQYSPGQITLEYNSNSDDRSFRVVQKSSDWTSQALLDNFINNEEHRFQTFQDKGKTIYIYEGSNATWVSGGIWYQIEGESSLTSDQLLRIAGSL